VAVPPVSRVGGDAADARAGHFAAPDGERLRDGGGVSHDSTVLPNDSVVFGTVRIVREWDAGGHPAALLSEASVA
jgi:hypothetical protein